MFRVIVPDWVFLRQILENVVNYLEKLSVKKKILFCIVLNSRFFGIVSHIGNSITDVFPSLACYKRSTKSGGRKEVKAGMGGTRRVTEKKRERRKTEKGARTKAKP